MVRLHDLQGAVGLAGDYRNFVGSAVVDPDHLIGDHGYRDDDLRRQPRAGVYPLTRLVAVANAGAAGLRGFQSVDQWLAAGGPKIESG